MKRDRVTYAETYKEGRGSVRADRLPTLQHSNGVQPVACDVVRAGVLVRAGVEYEFQDLRILLPREPKP